MHEYKVVWAPTQIEYYVDEVLYHTDKGTQSTIPYTAGHELIILRPKDNTYISDSSFSVDWASYSPQY